MLVLHCAKDVVLSIFFISKAKMKQLNADKALCNRNLPNCLFLGRRNSFGQFRSARVPVVCTVVSMRLPRALLSPCFPQCLDVLT